MALKSESLLPHVSNIQYQNPWNAIAEGAAKVGQVMQGYEDEKRKRAQHEASLAQSEASIGVTKAQTKGLNLSNREASNTLIAREALGKSPSAKIFGDSDYNLSYSDKVLNPAYWLERPTGETKTPTSQPAQSPQAKTSTAQTANAQTNASLAITPRRSVVELPLTEEYDSPSPTLFANNNTQDQPLPYYVEKVRQELERDNAQNAKLIGEEQRAQEAHPFNIDKTASETWKNYQTKTTEDIPYKKEYFDLAKRNNKAWGNDNLTYTAAMQAANALAPNDYEGRYGAMLLYLKSMGETDLKIKQLTLTNAELKPLNGAPVLGREFMLLVDNMNDDDVGGRFGWRGRTFLAKDWAGGFLTPPQAVFRTAYEGIQQIERHELFGATLTGNELTAWRAYAPKLTDDAASFKAKVYALNAFAIDKYEAIIDNAKASGKQFDEEAIRASLNNLYTARDSMNAQGWANEETIKPTPYRSPIPALRGNDWGMDFRNPAHSPARLALLTKRALRGNLFYNGYFKLPPPPEGGKSRDNQLAGSLFAANYKATRKR
ncbi:MAG: hypothetical protein LBF86_01950 [Helicobacteraceae bacterium]|jgi:hypothetical protein|nr:hypothetical protein [Helicobacteraceae bacterium]